MSGLSNIVTSIEQTSLLDISAEFKKLFLENGQVLLFAEGEVLCEQGKPLSFLMLPLSDNVRLVDQADRANPRFVGYLQRGRSLCLGQILDRQVAPYSAVAEVHTSVLCVAVATVLDYLESQPLILHYLRLMTRSTGARSLKSFLKENDVSIESMFSLFDTFTEEVSLEPAEELTLSPPFLYLIDSGRVRAESNADAAEKFVAELGEGSWFGGEALVSPRRCSYSVKAVQRTVLRRASLTEVEPLLAQLGMVDKFYHEPWIIRGSHATTPDHAEATPAIRSELPGRVLTSAEIGSLGVTVDPRGFLLPSSDSDSALASIANLSLLTGIEVNLANIQVELGLARKLSFLTLAGTLERFGAVTTPLKCEFSELASQKLPCLAPFGRRITVLFAATKDSVILLDPCRGFITVERAAYIQHWQGHILEVAKAEADFLQADEARGAKDAPGRARPTSEPRKSDADEGYRRVLRVFIAAFKDFRVVTLNRLGLGLLLVLLSLVTPQISQFMIDSVLGLRDLGTIWALSIGLVGAATLSGLVALVSGLVLGEFSFRFDRILYTIFYRHALRSREAGEIGDVVSRLGEMHKFADFVSTSAFMALIDVGALLFSSVMLMLYSPLLAIIGLAVFPALVLVRLGYMRPLKRIYDRVFDAVRKGRSLIAEQIGAIATIKSRAAEEPKRFQCEEVFVEGAKLTREAVAKYSEMDTLVQLVTIVAQLTGLTVALKLAASGKLTIGQVYAVNLYFMSMFGPANRVTHFFGSVEQIKVSFRRAADVFLVPLDEQPSRALVSHSTLLKGKIKLERLGFRYSDETPWALQDINLTIYPRQIVAIVGRSGCGKTTLARLIAGSLAPTVGRLFFDDYDSTLLSRSCLRQQIGVISQQNDLFAGSIAGNIGYADDLPSIAKMDEATTQAGAAEFVSKLAGGLDYVLAEGGQGLSGGQKQRISISQALYRDPVILVMDEATSALDAESEQVIVTKLRGMLQGRTTLIVAHRLSTIRHADRIIVMNDGRIVEEGDHDTLMRLDGYYNELFKDQSQAGDA